MSWEEFRKVYPNEAYANYYNYRDSAADEATQAFDKIIGDEWPDVVDGWYSPIEKRVKEVKQDKMSANKWKEIVGKGDEATWTGVKAWLDSLPPTQTISKEEVVKWMKDNRVEIKEVEKTDSPLAKKFYSAEWNESEQGWDVYYDGQVVDIFPKSEGFNTADEAIEGAINIADEDYAGDFGAKSSAKFAQYQTPGEKSNYKEILVTMPKAKGKFKSSHFDEPNILVHLRMNTRIDSEGKKVLFLEEVQSDWGQKGKKEGFREATPKADIDAVGKYNTLINKQKSLEEKAVDYILKNKAEELKGEFEILNKQISEAKKQLPNYAIIKDGFANIDVKTSVPAAPFVTDTNAWTKLGLKVALKEAVKQGADKIAWTTGEQQNDRYDLSKQVDAIIYRKNEDGDYYISAKKDNQNVFTETNVSENKLESFFGKDVAQRIINSEGEKGQANSKVLKGGQLSVGGKGMKGFYGSPSEKSLGIVGNVAKSLFKQEPKTVTLGEVKTLGQRAAIEENRKGLFNIYDREASPIPLFKDIATREEAEVILNEPIKNKTTQHSVDITPEMRQEVIEKGLPMFKLVPEGFVRVEGHMQTVSEYIDKAQAFFNAVFPGMKVKVYETQEEYSEATGAPMGSAGRWTPGSTEVSINLSAIRRNPDGTNTPIHEAIHPIVEAIYGRDSKVLDGLREQLLSLLDEKGLEAVKQHWSHYFGRGEDVTTIEGITEFLTMVAEGKIDPSSMPRTTWGKVSKFINDLFDALGIKFRVTEPNDLRKFAESIQQAFVEGNASAIKGMIKNAAPSAQKELAALDKIIEDEESDAEAARKIKEIIEKYPDLDPQLLKDYIKEKTGWKESKVNIIFNETGVAHVYTNEILAQIGFDQYEASEETIDAWNAEADKRISAGYDTDGLLKGMRDGTRKPDKIEQRILGKYISALKTDYDANPSSEKINHLKWVIDLAQRVGGTEQARSLAARRGAIRAQNTLADFMMQDIEANSGAPLTAEQERVVKEEYEAIKNAQAAWEKKVAELEEKNAKLEAEKALLEIKNQSKGSKPAKTDFDARKKDIAENIRKKWKDAGKQTYASLPFVPQLVAIAPDVAKYVRVLIDQGVTNLGDIIKELHPLVKEVMPDATERDVMDLVGGKYNEKKATRNELAAKKYELTQEAKLLGQIEDLENGIQPTNEKKTVKKNQELAELRKKLAELQKKEVGDTPAKDELAAYKSRVKNQIAKINKQLETNDFAPAPKKVGLVLDEEAKQLRDDLVKAKHNREVRLLKNEFEKLSTKDKAIEFAGKLLNVPRTLMATLDFSAVLIQGAIASGYSKEAAASFKQMLKATGSEKEFNAWMQALKDSPRYELMKEVKLGLTDPDSPYVTAQEELFFARNLVDQVGDWNPKALGGKFRPFKYASELNKASERSYVQYLNKMRADIFNRIVDEFEADGKTFENSPELYKSLGTYINNITGRGTAGQKFETFSPILSALFFSPRMIASRLALIKMLPQAITGVGMTPTMRKIYAKDMVKFVGVRVALLGLAKMALNMWGDDDDDIEVDPRSSDFGRVKINNTRFDVWGGFQPYARLITQLAFMEKKSTKTGEIQDMTNMGSFSETRGSLTAKFLRGKLSPMASYLVDMGSGKDYMGRPIETPEQRLIRTRNLFIPMIGSSIYDIKKDLGWGVIPGAALNMVGITSNTYDSKIVSTSKPIKLYDKKNKESYDASQEQMDLYAQTRDKITTDLYAQIESKGGKIDFDDYGSVVVQSNKFGKLKFGGEKSSKQIEFEKLTDEQKQELRMKISMKAGRDAKKIVFGDLAEKE